MYNDNMPYYGRNEGSEERPKEQGYGKIVSNGIPKIRVIGVGGAGNNAVNRMIDSNITSAEYIAVNTDAQILLCNKAPVKIQIGAQKTNGLGAGADPEVGREAAEENKEELTRAIEGTNLLFITAGMGGGTGTGAAPVIAKIAKDMKILTVAVVTEPFEFEGKKRMENATRGIDNLRKYVDTLVIIPNEKINEVVNKSVPITEAFAVADDVLKQGIRGIADLIVTPSLINLDFADVRTILKDRGLAHMGVGVAKGENRIVEAVRHAVNSPLLETTIEGATGIIINVVGGNDLSIGEINTAVGLVRSVVDYNANIIFGAAVDPEIQEEVEVTVIATGFPSAAEILSELDARQTAFARERQLSAPQEPVRETPAPPVDPYTAIYGRPAPQAAPQNAYRQPPQRPYAPADIYQQPAGEHAPASDPAPSEDPDDAGRHLPPYVRKLLGKRK